MNRKHFLLALGLFLAVALAMLWLITMAISTPEPPHTTPVIAPPVPVQPAPVPLAPTGATAPAGRTGIVQTARLQPEPQPVPTPEATPVTGLSPAAANPWHVAPPAGLGLLALLSMTGLVWLAAARISSGVLEARGA